MSDIKKSRAELYYDGLAKMDEGTSEAYLDGLALIDESGRAEECPDCGEEMAIIKTDSGGAFICRPCQEMGESNR